MGKNNFAEMEQRLADYSDCYEKVSGNLEQEILRRDQQRLDQQRKAEEKEQKLKRLLYLIFLVLCGVVLFTAYKIIFGGA